jgi:hypothetical protein
MPPKTNANAKKPRWPRKPVLAFGSTTTSAVIFLSQGVGGWEIGDECGVEKGGALWTGSDRAMLKGPQSSGCACLMGVVGGRGNGALSTVEKE